jgi:iron complex outermembrane receptor protein
MSFHGRRLAFVRGLFVATMACALLAGVLRAQVVRPAPAAPAEEHTFELSPLLVTDQSGKETYDPTGMDGPEVAMNEPPFSNDLLAGDNFGDDMLVDSTAELQAIGGVAPADMAAAVSRVNLKGFPTPRLRNGFTQVGFPEVLNSASVELIQGPITPVTGKAAPGGIQNFVTARPRGKTFSRFDFGASSRDTRSASAEFSSTLVPKKVWQRVAVAWGEGKGPQPFAYDRRRFIDASLVWKASRSASTMLQVDYEDRAANASYGVPEFRASKNDPVTGPFRPLAYFSVPGPDAGLRKRTASASLQFEGQFGKRVSARAGAQVYQRELDEDRWTNGQYLLDTGKFGGTREPQHQEQPFFGVATQAEATARFFAGKADHKVTLALENTHTDSQRTQRALQKADRDALPVDVRTFDPAAPNYFRPDYTPEFFSRIITDRRDVVDFTGVVLSERAAFAHGRLVLTAGGRKDFVSIDVTDSKPGASRPKVRDRVSEFSHHFGANYILVKNRVLAFANTSTAFEPSTRIDARTGRVQGNETTLGYEGGAKMLFLERKLVVTALAFSFANQNISRRNPLYDDPIADANQTQPQLVAGAEERFTGGSVELRSKPNAEWTFSGRAVYTRAITTQSPDLPEEVGRALTRYPRFNAALAARYTVAEKKRFAGFNVGASVTAVSGFVANYENASHHYLDYPGYSLVSASAGYRWKTGKRAEHSVGVNVRNLFNRDLLALQARPAADRDYAVSYGLTF